MPRVTLFILPIQFILSDGSPRAKAAWDDI